MGQIMRVIFTYFDNIVHFQFQQLFAAFHLGCKVGDLQKTDQVC